MQHTHLTGARTFSVHTLAHIAELCAFLRRPQGCELALQVILAPSKPLGLVLAAILGCEELFYVCLLALYVCLLALLNCLDVGYCA